MVVAQSISADPKALLRTEAPSVENRSTIASPPEFALGREVSFFSSVCEQLVESPSDGDAFLDDEDEERGETDVLEGTSARLRQVSITNTKHATSTEDAFQSYLRDIRR